jgi:hypothetical protein
MLAIQPTVRSRAGNLPDTLPLDASDGACISEIRDILARYGKLDRFALHLALVHMPLGLDEIWIGRFDPDGRTQHVTVGKGEGTFDNMNARRPWK